VFRPDNFSVMRSWCSSEHWSLPTIRRGCDSRRPHQPSPRLRLGRPIHPWCNRNMPVSKTGDPRANRGGCASWGHGERESSRPRTTQLTVRIRLTPAFARSVAKSEGCRAVVSHRETKAGVITRCELRLGKPTYRVMLRPAVCRTAVVKQGRKTTGGALPPSPTSSTRKRNSRLAALSKRR